MKNCLAIRKAQIENKHYITSDKKKKKKEELKENGKSCARAISDEQTSSIQSPVKNQ